MSGRILGPTWLYGRPSRMKYVPVMTNSSWDAAVEGKGGYPPVYGIRWMGLVSWKSGVYLHVDDGSDRNHHYYVQLTLAEDQGNIEDGIRG